MSVEAPEFESATRSRAEELAALAKARTVISQKTVGAESFSYSLVESFFLHVSRSLLSSCVDIAKFEVVRRIRDLAKRERSLGESLGIRDATARIPSPLPTLSSLSVTRT